MRSVMTPERDYQEVKSIDKIVQLRGPIPLKQKREKLRRRDFFNMIVIAKTHSNVWEVKPYLGQTSFCIVQY